MQAQGEKMRKKGMEGRVGAWGEMRGREGKVTMGSGCVEWSGKQEQGGWVENGGESMKDVK